jgi:hypothetical protein
VADRPPVHVRADGFSTRSPPPNPPVGSREHYFHFLLGYLLPLVDAVGGARREISVLDCGPLMTPILTSTLTRLGVRHRIVAPSDTPWRLYLPLWDHAPCWPRLARAADRVRTALSDAPCPGSGCAPSRNLLLRRSAPPAFYRDGSAEIPGYGDARRAVTNLSALSQALHDAGIAHQVYEPGAHALACQIRAFRGARRIFGVRGAEWANMVWCERGVTTAYIIHPGARNGLLDRVLARYARAYTLELVDRPHSAAEVSRATAFFLGDA